MRNIATKFTGTSNLSAPEFNSFINELENAVTSTSQALDSGSGPDTDLQMLARALVIAGQSASLYQDSGGSNTYILGALGANLVQPTAYYNGLTVIFKAGSTNTGAALINVAALGNVSLRNRIGGVLTANEIVLGNWVAAVYVQSVNQFQIILNTTPPPAGVTRPDQAATYIDNGAGNVFALIPAGTVVPPVSYTNGLVVAFKSARTLTGAATINLNSLGARAFVNENGAAFGAGDIRINDWVLAVFHSGNNRFELITKTLQIDIPGLERIFPASDTGSSASEFRCALTDTSKGPVISLVNGLTVEFELPLANAADPTVKVEGLAAKPLVFPNGGAIPAGFLQSQDYIRARYISALDRFDLIHRSGENDDMVAPGTVSGSGAPWTFTPSSNIRLPPALVDGLTVVFQTSSAAPNNPSLNVGGFGAKPLRFANNATIRAGQIGNAQRVMATYRASGDRWEVVAHSTHPLAVGYGAFTSNVINGDVPINAQRVLQWGTPTYDDLGFYNSTNRTFVVPSGQGIQRIDVSLALVYSMEFSQHCAARLTIGSATVAVSHLDTASGAGFGEGNNISVIGFPVSGGEQLELTVQPQGGSINVTQAHFSIRASKLAA